MTKIVIYTKENCAYCNWAKELLDSKQLKYEEIRVDLDPEKLAEMLKLSQRRTTPQIFINDQPIGGYDDLTALANSGELSRLVNSN